MPQRKHQCQVGNLWVGNGVWESGPFNVDPSIKICRNMTARSALRSWIRKWGPQQWSFVDRVLGPRVLMDQRITRELLKQASSSKYQKCELHEVVWLYASFILPPLCSPIIINETFWKDSLNSVQNINHIYLRARRMVVTRLLVLMSVFPTGSLWPQSKFHLPPTGILIASFENT